MKRAAGSVSLRTVVVAKLKWGWVSVRQQAEAAQALERAAGSAFLAVGLVMRSEWEWVSAVAQGVAGEARDLKARGSAEEARPGEEAAGLLGIDAEAGLVKEQDEAVSPEGETDPGEVVVGGVAVGRACEVVAGWVVAAPLSEEEAG